MGWNLTRRLVRKYGAVALLIGAMAAQSNQAANAQAVYTSVSNSYVTAVVGVSGQTAGATPAVNAAGRLGVFQAGANAAPLLNPAASIFNQSYLTIRIDGGPATPGQDADAQTQSGWDLIWGDVGSNQQDASTTAQKTGQGAWLQQPTAIGSGRIVARWTTLPGGNTNFPIPPIEVDLTLTLIHDMVQYQFTVINRDNAAHAISLRFAQDFNVPAATDGPVLTPNLAQICNETDLTGGSIPPFWRSLNNNTGDSTGAVLSSQFGGSSTITTPDRVTFGANGNAVFPLWNFTPNPALSFCTTPGDGSSGVYFRGYQAAPGDARTFTTYFGRQRSSADFERPWAAGVDAPFSLKFDPTKPVGQQLTPNPLTVTAFVHNLSQLSLTNVTAVISLPNGLRLADGETAAKTTPTLDVDSETTFSWRVVPTGTSSGRQSIAVSFSAGPGTQGKVVTREIDIPALPIQTLPGGLQMVSFPYSFADPTPTAALGLSQIDFDLLRWNPTISQYEAVTRIFPGEGYWLRLASERTLNLQGATPITVGTTPFEIQLRRGWEQIGNPYLYRVRWNDVKVINTDSGEPDYLVPLTIEQAAQRGWINPTIYWYDPVDRIYKFDQDLSTDLIPFRGYWVKALKSSLSLLIPPTSGRSAPLNRVTRAATAGPGAWSLRLVATSQGTTDSWNFIGVAPGSSDAFDRKDFEKPPMISGQVQLGIVRNDWGGRAGLYTQDIQSPSGGRKQWNVLVTSPAPNADVTVAWPDINSLPRGYELYITDAATGQRKLMRQALSTRINTGATATRAFTITAEPRSGASVFLLNAAVQTTKGPGSSSAKIEVSSTQDSTISVRVLGANGQSIRTIAGGRAASAGGRTAVVWDYKDNKGVSVPSGVYTIEVRGTTPDGQSARSLVPHVITR